MLAPPTLGAMRDSEDGRRNRPPGLIVAAAGSAAVAAVLVVLAGASLASGHGRFSGGVALVLLLYGAAVGAASWGLWRGSLLARGPVLATSLLHVAVAAGYLAEGPLAWAVLVVSLAAVVGVALPATSRALRGPGAGVN